MNVTFDPPTTAAHRRRLALRPWWPWLATFAAFPPAGYVGRMVAGPVDTAAAAALAGVTTGAIFGAGQWLLLRRRGISARWIAATAAGFGAGLTAGAAAVGYSTSRPALAIMGAITGAAVAFAQAAAVGARRSGIAAWAAAAAVLWPLAWMASSGVIDVADQWPVFGSSGALLVVVVQSFFVERVLPVRARVDSAVSR